MFVNSDWWTGQEFTIDSDQKQQNDTEQQNKQEPSFNNNETRQMFDELFGDLKILAVEMMKMGWFDYLTYPKNKTVNNLDDIPAFSRFVINMLAAQH